MIRKGTIPLRNPLIRAGFIIGNMGKCDPAPENVVATFANNKITLSWDTSEDDALVGYNVYLQGIKQNTDIIKDSEFSIQTQKRIISILKSITSWLFGNNTNLKNAGFSQADSNNPQYAQVDNNAAYDFSGDFTVRVCICHTTQGQRGDVFSKKDQFIDPNRLPHSSNQLGLYFDDGNFLNVFIQPGIETASIMKSTRTFPISVTKVWDLFIVRSGSTVSLYVDSSKENQITVSGDLTSDGPIRFAANRSNTAGAVLFPCSCYIDEVAIWTRALTSDELAHFAGHQAIARPTDLVGWWPMNDASGTIIPDDSPIRNHATFHGASGNYFTSPIIPMSGLLDDVIYDVGIEAIYKSEKVTKMVEGT